VSIASIYAPLAIRNNVVEAVWPVDARGALY